MKNMSMRSPHPMFPQPENPPHGQSPSPFTPSEPVSVPPRGTASHTPRVPAIGCDIVWIPGIAEQLTQPGTSFTRVLSGIERRAMAARPKARRAEFFAGRYAAKEAIIKAWEQTLVGCAPPLGKEEVDFAEISVEPDPWGRLEVRFQGKLKDIFVGSLPGCWVQVSISHDGDYAMAQAMVAAELGGA